MPVLLRNVEAVCGSKGMLGDLDAAGMYDCEPPDEPSLRRASQRVRIGCG